MAPNDRTKNAVAGVLVALAAAFLVSMVLINTSTAVSLDQYEIGEYDTDPLESAATDKQYEDARPWRDPGHISREEIRYTRAVRAMDTVPRDSTWDVPRLWSKYIQAMKDPTLVEPGWTSTRTLTPGADPIQRAMERHAYGAEGHREPEPSWSEDENQDSDINDVLDRNDDRFAALERKQEELSKISSFARQAINSGDFEPYGGPAPRKVSPMLTSTDRQVAAIVNEMKAIHEDIRGISSAMKNPRGLGQQLRDSEAEVKDLEQDDATEKQRIAAMEKDIKSLRQRKDAPKPTKSRMSSLEAAKDLSDYFDQLGAQTAADEAKHVRAELAQLQAMNGGGARRNSAAAPCPAGSYCPSLKHGASKASRARQSLSALVKELLPRNQAPILPTV